MFPREHGAYGQLLFPLVTALAIARPGASAFALAGAAIATFIAHEPLLVLLGQRGARAARAERRRALAWFGGFGVAAVVLAAAGIARMPPAARLALAVPAVLALVLAAVIAVHREHTTGGEILSAVTLSSLSLPIALAAGATLVASLTCVLVFAASFVVATLAVRAMIVWMRHPLGASTRVGAAALAAGAVGALVVLARASLTTEAAPWAALPVCAIAFVLAALAPSPRHVRAIGWLLVGATALEAIVLVAALR